MSTHENHEEDLFLETDDEVQENKFLMCRIGSEDYGIDIRHVTDIIELQKITEVPDMPNYVKGVINLRGQVIPIIDLRLRFGMEQREYDDRTVIAVVKIDELSIGFIVDTATEVQEIPDADIEEAPSFKGNEARNRFVAGLGKVGEDVKIILDVSKLVVHEEMLEVKEAL
jgi:purine-binding chemotaxis protein CheW